MAPLDSVLLSSCHDDESQMKCASHYENFWNFLNIEMNLFKHLQLITSTISIAIDIAVDGGDDDDDDDFDDEEMMNR